MTLQEIARHKKAAENADWTQVVLNGGPPCFHFQEDGTFCLRAERWIGHEPWQHHAFVSLAQLIENASAKKGHSLP